MITFAIHSHRDKKAALIGRAVLPDHRRHIIYQADQYMPSHGLKIRYSKKQEAILHHLKERLHKLYAGKG